MMLEDYLRKNAERHPDKIAVVCGDQSCTYRQLAERVSERAATLLVKDKLVPFRSLPSIDFLVTYFAIHQAGGICVPLEKDLSDRQFEEYRERFKDTTAPSGTADVLFTTGTTGKSKGVMVSHAAIIADAENLIDSQGYHPDLTFLINGPLNHIGSLSKIYPTILVGGTIHILDGMKDLSAFFRAIDEAPSHVATFLVPSSIRMLLAFSADRLAACKDKMEFIETGAAPIALADMERLCNALPKSRLYNTYASTETGIIATYDYNNGDCLAGCLGKPMRHSHLFITEKGTIACQGDTLMTGYFGDEALTASVLRDGTLYTADLGEIDEEGRLRLRGRNDDVINVGGYKVVPTEVEDAALSLPSVKECVCIPSRHPVLGTVLKLLVVLNEGCSLDKRQMALSLKERLESYKVPMQYEQVDQVKRTFNGKIDRKAYR